MVSGAKSMVRGALDQLPDSVSYWAYAAYDAARALLVRDVRWPDAVERYCGILRAHPQVLSGPFAGTKYIRRSCGSPWLPKLLGTYEAELNPIVEVICDLRPDVIIDIGCAEGYYAVGLARRLPRAKVVGYDIESRARHALRRLASINGVADRVVIRSRCTHRELRAVLGDAANAVVISDCESAEDELLMPEHVPQLARATVLVEAHDCIIPGISERIRARFADTHSIRTIDSRNPSLADLPRQLGDAPEEVVQHLRERAMPMQWLFLQPLNGADRKRTHVAGDMRMEPQEHQCRS